MPQVPPIAPPLPAAPATPPPSSIAVTAPMPRSAIPTPPAPNVTPPATDAAELKRLAALAAAEFEEQGLEEGPEDKTPEPEPVKPASPPADPEPAKPAPAKSEPETPVFSAPEKPEPDLKQFTFNAPEKPAPVAPAAPLIPSYDRPAPPVAATARFKLPDTLREAAQTTPITPFASEAVPTARTTRFTPPTPAPTPHTCARSVPDHRVANPAHESSARERDQSQQLFGRRPFAHSRDEPRARRRYRRAPRQARRIPQARGAARCPPA